MDEKMFILILNDVVVFPGSSERIELDSNNDMLKLLDIVGDKEVVIVNPIDDEVTNITSFPKYGVLGKITLKINVPNSKTRIVIEGEKRVELYSIIKDGSYYKCSYKNIDIVNTELDDSYKKILIKELKNYIAKVPNMGNAILSQLDGDYDLSSLCDLVASYLPIDYKDKKKYIVSVDPINRFNLLMEDMSREIKFASLEERIDFEVEQELNESQKEYFLREKIRVIEKELGTDTTHISEVERLRKKVNRLKCSNKVKEKIKREIDRYEALNSNSPEVGMVREYIDWMTHLPWGVYTKDTTNLENVKKVLDSSHYGLNDVKERILEYIAVKQNTNDLHSPIICLVGPPGVGKTTLAMSIASSLGRRLTKISVGGINDEAEIIGHRRTYIGANPGRIIQGLRRAGSANPVFIIDEIDKMRKDIKGDPASALLEVLDKEQNSKFYDHYIEEDFDLSKVMFIATANYIEQIPNELRDRLEVINISSYTEYDKLDIAKNYLIPKQLEENGLTPLQVSFKDEAIMYIIRGYTKEAGVRELERCIASLLRKVVKELLLNKNSVFYNIDVDSVEKLLGSPKYKYNETLSLGDVGVVNGMAYTVFGGDILPIEATSFKGKGEVTLTGSLGEVMQESCHIALDYVKSNMDTFSIGEEAISNKDIHIHVPEGAVNKDGPSAGVAITTVLISLFKGVKIPSTIAMTGEITLRGRVLPVGGLKEKIIGAHRANIKRIFIPKENERDLSLIPDEVKKDIEFILVSNYLDIYKEVFK